jgi:hypothetical protein
MFRRIADLAGLWYMLGLVATVLLGIVGLGFVGFEWLVHFVSSGHYMASALVVLAGLAVLGFAAFRVPLALFLLFGGAMLLGTAYVVGAINVLLP